jgi:Glycosyltransferase
MGSVLIISFWNPTEQKPERGIFIHEQIKALSSFRNDIFFLQINILSARSFFQTAISETYHNGNINVTLNIYSIFWKWLYYNPWLLYRIIRNILTKKYSYLQPKIIHSNIIFPCGAIGYLLARKYRAKHIISEHWSKAENFVKNPLYGKLILKSYRSSKAVLCVSNFLASKIKSLIQSENVMVVPNVIDSKIFKYSVKINENESTLRFFCIGAWDIPKRLDLVINSLEAFAKRTNKRIVLNIIRKRADHKEEQFHRLYPDNFIINWLGYMEKHDIVSILAKTDYFLQASDMETFSIVTVEALSTGTPVLASNVGALPEFINESNGILVENTIDAWVHGLEEITSTSFDNQRIAEEISGKFSPEIVGKMIDTIYNSIIDN